MIYNIVTLICLVLLALEALYVLLNVLFKPRAERIGFVRNFKNGKCAIIYVTAVPLYYIGNIYAGDKPLDAFFDSIRSIIELVVLKYDRPAIQLLMEANTLYAVAVYICFTLVGVNALLLTFSLIAQHVWVGFHSLMCALNGKSTVYIFGNNEENKLIYHSEKNRNKMIVDRIGRDDCTLLYQENVLFSDVPSELIQFDRIFSIIKHFERECILVINTGDDDKNVKLCREIVDRIESTDKDDRDLLYRELKVFVFGAAKYEGVYSDIVASSSGCISYVNKHRMIASDFVENYPISAFMTEEHIDLDTSLVKKDVNINVILLGFGKTNQQIFLTSVANNQFVTEGVKGGDPVIKQVNYHIIENGASKNNKNLNHTYYRFRNEMADVDLEDYLPLPDIPARETLLDIDINATEYYSTIHSIISDPHDVNLIVIAYASDLENIDMAQKLIEKRDEWQLDNFVIFAKANEWRKDETFIGNDNCFLIGNLRDSVYNINRIYGDRLEEMSHLRSMIHLVEYDITANPDLRLDSKYLEKVNEQAEYQWYVGLSQNQRESNLYGCLSLRSKLHMMGLDYLPKNTPGITPLTEEEYMSIYAAGDMPRVSPLPAALGKPIYEYDLNFARATRRRNLAVHEHLRWNSFMISKGFVPSSKEQILTETVVTPSGKVAYSNGKRFDLRRHGNLTTLDGLTEFGRMIAGRDGISEADADKIKYDYQILDDAFWLLDRCGYAIVRR